MIIDDEPDLLVVTSKMLEQDGYVIHAFNNPIEALAHVKDMNCKDCSIVISDVRMPGMSGFELVRELKAIRPEIQVILMTAFKMNKQETQIVLPSTKVDAFLNKPFKTADLRAAIKECASSH